MVTERPEKVDHGLGVGDVGDVVEGGGTGAAERAGEHGKDRALGAADVDMAEERGRPPEMTSLWSELWPERAVATEVRKSHSRQR